MLGKRGKMVNRRCPRRSPSFLTILPSSATGTGWLLAVCGDGGVEYATRGFLIDVLADSAGTNEISETLVVGVRWRREKCGRRRAETSAK